jgi:uncharacterized protein
MPDVRNVPSGSRYEIWVDGQRAGLLRYRDRGDVLVAVHTEVDDAFEGQGLAGELVAAVLADVRTSGRRVRPLCPYVRGYLERHPEYADLVVKES